MDAYDEMRKGLCPNKCGELNFIGKPISTFQVLPSELIDIIIEYQERNPIEAEYLEQIITNTHIIAICAKCGFCLQTTGDPSSTGRET